MSTQIRVTLSEEIYKQLLDLSKEEMRSISNQASVIIKKYFTSPAPVPAPTPVYIPYNEPTTIHPPFEPYATPEPYKITLQSNAQPEESAPAQSAPVQTPGTKTTPEPKPEPDNEWYKKLKKGYRTLYGENSPEWRELLHMAAHPDIKAFMKTQHRNDVEQIITNSYEHILDIYEFEELLDYLNRGPRRPQQINKKKGDRIKCQRI